MNYNELNTKIANLKSEIEKLVIEVNQMWMKNDKSKLSASILLMELEDCLIDAADNISKWEDNEKLKRQLK